MRAGGVLVVLCCLATAPALAAVAEPCPATVRVSLPDFEIKPYVLGSGRVESPPGLLIEWTRQAVVAAAAALPGCTPQVTVQRRPPNRQLAEAAQGLLDVLPGFSYSANPTLAYPMHGGAVDPRRAILADNVSLYVRAGDTSVRWDGLNLTSRNRLVGTSTGGASTEETAQQYGWRLEAAATPATDLHKLLAGRIDVIMEPDVVMTPLLQGELGAQVRRLLPPARQSLRYAAVRKGFAAQYPAFTQRFWHEMCVASRAGGTALPACR